MSTLNTAQLRVIPTAVSGFTVTNGPINTFGSWVEFIAANAIAAPIAVAGFNVSAFGTSGSFEIQVGVGSAGSEVVVGNIIHLSGYPNDNIQIHMLPTPLNAAISNQRLALRIRSDQPNTAVPIALLYYRSIAASTATDEPYTYLPYGSLQNGTLVTPNTTPWGDSAWFQMTSSLDSGSRILGIAPFWGAGYANIDWEVDIGIGESGSETVVTTLRNMFPPSGLQGLHNTYLPAAYSLSGAQRVSCRLRKAGVAPATFSVYLIYLPAPSVVATIDSLGCGLMQGQIAAFGTNLDIAGTVSVTLDGDPIVSSVVSTTSTTMIIEIEDYEDGLYCVTVDANPAVCATLSCGLPQITPASWRLHRFDLRPSTGQRN